MTNFDLSVRDWRGRVIGYRCIDCGGVFLSMWGNVCNGCRDKERRHQELIAAIKASKAEGQVTKPANDELTPDDVIKMRLAEFGRRFGFRPVDALEKKHFAVTGNRLNQLVRDAIEAGVIGDSSTEDVVME